MNMDLRTRRNPDKTREALLHAAFGEIHRAGFQAASLDMILSTANVTKGALYHHFPNKAALGYAVVEEVIKPFITERWVRPLDGADDPIQIMVDGLADMCRHVTPADIELGCPLNNLMQEMSPVDEGFRQRLSAVGKVWQSAIARALARGQGRGTVRDDVDPEKTAAFLCAAYEGIAGTAKNAQSTELLRSNLDVLADYLDGLRPPRGAPVGEPSTDVEPIPA
jgi:AcrR family transcriptional regulator